MAFEKGNKLGKGRPTGSTNKASGQIRTAINAFLLDNLDTVMSTWDELEGRDKVNFWRDLLKYSVPQLQHTELTGDLDGLSTEQLEFILSELKAEMKENNGGTSE